MTTQVWAYIGATVITVIGFIQLCVFLYDGFRKLTPEEEAERKALEESIRNSPPGRGPGFSLRGGW